MPARQPRSGVVLEAKGRPLPFSFFSVTRNNRRYGLYDAVFTVNPWIVMRGTVNSELAPAFRPEARAFLDQAEDFYRAATAGISTNPLLLYYAFLNLAKALIRVRGFTGSLDNAMHGLKVDNNGVELEDSSLVVKDGGNYVNVFGELLEQLGYPRPRNNTSYPVAELLPQVVVGHRIWREAAPAHSERFVDLKEIEFVDDRNGQQLWLRFYVSRGDLARYAITRDRLLREGGLHGDFAEVAIAATGHEDDLVCFEQTQATHYTGRPTDVVADLVAGTRVQLWRIISAMPGASYRRYYLHMSPQGSVRVPQLASLWGLFFYFGSVVRYRPHHFDELLSGEYGAFIAEFISSQAEQMAYLLASEFSQREIAKPAIV